MRDNLLSKEEIVKMFGENAIEQLNSLNAQFTHSFFGEEEITEFSATLKVEFFDMDEKCKLSNEIIVFYYHKTKDVISKDFSDLTWIPSGYYII